MIRLERDGLVMEVCNELQASVFERNGYVRVKAKQPEPVVEVKPVEPVAQEPKAQVQTEEGQKKRRRKGANAPE